MDLLAQLMQQLPQRGEVRFEDGSMGKPLTRRQPSARRPQPQQSAAQAYERAMANGDYNSPAVIGVDPAQFGYPADEAVESTPTRVKYPRANPETGYYKAGPTSPAQMRQQPQQQDPLAQLRQLLGF